MRSRAECAAGLTGEYSDMTSMHDGDHEDGEDNLDGGIKPLAATDPVRIGPYLLLGRLGAGGMGRVYLARSEGGRTVAVKVVHPEHVADPQFRARFRREVDAARRVGERYTAPVLDAAPDEEYPWVATGYVPGLSLEQVVRGHGALPSESVLALADGLLRALKDIHSAGIVHRDLKPSNVMLTVEGPKVIDFGIARAVETSVDSLLTSTGMVIGSPGFMAPEQIRGESAGPKSDVFTLGCVLTYAATGKLPFGNGVSNQHAVMYHIVEAEPDVDQVRDEGLRTLITRLLAKSVAERPSVEALLAERGSEGLAAGASWLPAGVVGHLARQSARLLDAEAAPVRQESVDRGTVGLRAPAEVPVVSSVGGAVEPERKRDGRRRPWIVSVPLVVVLAGEAARWRFCSRSAATVTAAATRPRPPVRQPRRCRRRRRHRMAHLPGATGVPGRAAARRTATTGRQAVTPEARTAVPEYRTAAVRPPWGAPAQAPPMAAERRREAAPMRRAAGVRAAEVQAAGVRPAVARAAPRAPRAAPVAPPGPPRPARAAPRAPRADQVVGARCRRRSWAPGSTATRTTWGSRA